jgi:hypothetical protein
VGIFICAFDFFLFKKYHSPVFMFGIEILFTALNGDYCLFAVKSFMRIVLFYFIYILRFSVIIMK